MTIAQSSINCGRAYFDHFSAFSDGLPPFHFSDSAHRIHPLAGQGVNLGFADASCLARVIQAALSQGADPGEQARTGAFAGALRNFLKSSENSYMEIFRVDWGGGWVRCGILE